MLELNDFYYIRHGETNWNREHRGMGQKDIPLNKRGFEQAHFAADLLIGEPIRTICFSPLQRAKVTAEIIGQRLRIPMVEVPELIECCWGEKEGSVKGQWTEDWIAGVEIPGAEKYKDFLVRAAGAINKSLKSPGPVLVVAHGGVFWAVQHYCRLGSKVDLLNGTPIYLRAPINNNYAWSYSTIERK